MSWTLLEFLADPWFVIPWYAVGLVGAALVALDIARFNTPLKTAMKWAWPIIVVFFSIIGVVLYLTTARAPGLRKLDDKQRQRAHDDYERNLARRVNGAVIHCVAGDGLGIITAMVIARSVRMSPWQEFWFEYAVGFAFGWLIFQLKSMRMMTDSTTKALAMAFRAEMFSMLTVMGGMGAVMLYVTPLVVTTQPSPLTYAFWGFAMLGLVVGYVFTYPMNLMLVKIGWKHGMGSSKGANPVERTEGKLGLAFAMCVLGIGALVLPGLLVVHRMRSATRGVEAQLEATAIATLRANLQDTVAEAETELANDQGRARVLLDGAYRAAQVAAAAAPGTLYAPVLDNLREARHQLWMGRRDAAVEALRAVDLILSGASSEPDLAQQAVAYDGATVLDARGNMIGEIVTTSASSTRVAVGGIRDFWGFLDLGRGRQLEVPTRSLVFGRHQTVGPTYVVLATR